MFCLVTSITPGPNTIMLMASGLNHGINKSLPHLFGIIFGFQIMLACIGLGFGVVFSSYPIIHQVIKVFGIGYLLFIAWKIANSSNPEASEKIKKPFTCIQAMAFQWVNPKAWVIGIGAIATFTTIGNMMSQVAVIIVGYLTVGALSMLVWLLLGTSLQKLLRSQKQFQYFNMCMGMLLAVSVIAMAASEISNVI
ncbi:MAG: LysE family translocator [Cellvibrionaceae bacterium]